MQRKALTFGEPNPRGTPPICSPGAGRSLELAGGRRKRSPVGLARLTSEAGASIMPPGDGAVRRSAADATMRRRSGWGDARKSGMGLLGKVLEGENIIDGARAPPRGGDMMLPAAASSPSRL